MFPVHLICQNKSSSTMLVQFPDKESVIINVIVKWYVHCHYLQIKNSTFNMYMNFKCDNQSKVCHWTSWKIIKRKLGINCIWHNVISMIRNYKLCTNLLQLNCFLCYLGSTCIFIGCKYLLTWHCSDAFESYGCRCTLHIRHLFELKLCWLTSLLTCKGVLAMDP